MRAPAIGRPRRGPRRGAAAGVRRAAAVAGRELASLFNSPVAYVVIAFHLALTAGWFLLGGRFFAAGRATLQEYFGLWPLVFIVLLPALTMRAWAEEGRLGTAELLLTLPLRERELVLGKFAASLALLGLLALLSLPVPLSVLPLGAFQAGPIVGQYAGVLLLGAAGLAAGMAVSALSANQVTAFLLGAAVLLALTLVGRVPALLTLPGWLAGALTWLSLDHHFESFRKGLLDSRDLLYFLVLTVGFLTVNTRVLLLRRMDRRGREALLLLLFAAGLALVLLNSSRFFVRLDLTRGGANTISPASRAIVAALPGKVRLTYYLSDALRPLTPEPGRVIDLLREYAAVSRGKVEVEVVDPQEAGRAESARRFGVLPQQVQVVRQGEQRTIDVFSGIVLEHLDRYTSLPAVFSSEGLEFGLSAGIRRLAAGRRIRVGVLLGRGDKSLERDYALLGTGLSRDFALREYLPGERLPPEADALLVLGGAGLDEAALPPLRRYVAEGGRVLFAVKGLRVETARSLSAAAAGPSAAARAAARLGGGGGARDGAGPGLPRVPAAPAGRRPHRLGEPGPLPAVGVRAGARRRGGPPGRRGLRRAGPAVALAARAAAGRGGAGAGAGALLPRLLGGAGAVRRRPLPGAPRRGPGRGAHPGPGPHRPLSGRPGVTRGRSGGPPSPPGWWWSATTISPPT